MVDLSKKKNSLNKLLSFSVATSAAVATFPMINLYQEKVRPVLQEKFPEIILVPIYLSLESITPHLIIGSSIMSFIMMYARSTGNFCNLASSSFTLLIVGIQITELALSIFI